MAIFDTMNFIKPDVSTLCTGMAASMGAFLLAAGAKGKRFSLPNSKVMIHQPLGGMQGQATDIEIHARDILKTRAQLNKILAERTGQPLEKIKRHRSRQFHARRCCRLRPDRQGSVDSRTNRNRRGEVGHTAPAREGLWRCCLSMLTVLVLCRHNGGMLIGVTESPFPMSSTG
jgi:hypothetical protein